MIEKLKTINPYDETEIDMNTNSVSGLVYENTPLVQKINELVDAVNSIVSVQEKLIDSRFVVEIKHEEPADPYAEQRKWIGKLCWFWNDNFKQCGILTAVFDNNKYKEDDLTKEYPFQRDSIGCWQHCEPVKPDDNIIYKGE